MSVDETNNLEVDSADGIVCCGIQCTDDLLCEMDRDPSAIRLRRGDIKNIGWRYGLLAPSPILQALFGAGLAAIGWYPLSFFIKWVRGGGTFPLELAFLIPIPAIGLWMVISVLRRGYFLDVELEGERKRVVFKGRPEAREVEAFVGAIVDRWGLRRNS